MSQRLHEDILKHNYLYSRIYKEFLQINKKNKTLEKAYMFISIEQTCRY